MTHRGSVVINRVIKPGPSSAAAENDAPEVEATVIYRPTHDATPQEIGKTVTRITRQMAELANPSPGE